MPPKRGSRGRGRRGAGAAATPARRDARGGRGRLAVSAESPLVEEEEEELEDPGLVQVPDLAAAAVAAQQNVDGALAGVAAAGLQAAPPRPSASEPNLVAALQALFPGQGQLFAPAQADNFIQLLRRQLVTYAQAQLRLHFPPLPPYGGCSV